MQYNIVARLANGFFVFSANTGWVPNKGDELEINGNVFVVDKVRYKLSEGTTYNTKVELKLTLIK